MANKPFRQLVDSRLSSVQLRPELRERIISGARPQRKKRPFVLRRGFLAGAAACLALVFGVGAAAAVFPSFDRLINNMGELGGLVQPVDKATEAHGVRMEVAAAVNDGESAVVYFTLQDLEGERIDENSRIYAVQLGDGEFAEAAMVHYDAAERIATYRVDCTGLLNSYLGKNVTLRIDNILLGEEFYEDVFTGYTLSHDMLRSSPAPVDYPLRNMAGDFETMLSHYDIEQGEAARMKALIDSGDMPVLSPNFAAMAGTPEFMGEIAAAVVEDYLHVQLRTAEGDAAYYNRRMVYLDYPGKENRWDGTASAGLGLNRLAQNGWQVHFGLYEWILEIPEDVDPQDVRLMAAGTGYSGIIEGSWQVSFQLDDDPELLEWRTRIELGGVTVHCIQLSAIGISAKGRGEQGENDPSLEMAVIRADGTEVEYYSVMTATDFSGNLLFKCEFADLVDLDDVAYVLINGEKYTVAQAE